MAYAHARGLPDTETRVPRGLHPYALHGAWNQRRVDAFTNIVRDPRITRHVADGMVDNLRGFGRTAGIEDNRLNNASSCFGCHADGMNRANNDLRDWLDAGSARLPRGEFGVDPWIDDPATVDRVRELYPTSAEMRPKIEDDRRMFLDAMAEIKEERVLGVDKNVYVEPTIWTIEWAQNHYDDATTRSN